uniref:Ig-like domain-containing protein n=1 Tax=Seriola dumerili TaxID=41447 RepID=A0A3B4V1P4_SERDU
TRHCEVLPRSTRLKRHHLLLVLCVGRDRWALALIGCSVFSPSIPVNITAAPGQTVSLRCQAARDTDITVVEWSRAEPEPEQVFLYRDKKPDPQNQSPSFQNRVELRDRQMKDGDVSLTLKDVTRDDTGRYECRVQTELILSRCEESQICFLFPVSL